MLRGVTLRELLTKSSPVTMGLLLVQVLLLGARLASARPTTALLRSDPAHPLDFHESAELRDLDVLSPSRALAVYRGDPSGAALLDWSRSAELYDDGMLGQLQLVVDRSARSADQLVTVDGQDVTVTGRLNHGWRFTWRPDLGHARRERLPLGFLWLEPTGEPVTLQSLELPDGWPEPYPASVVTSGHLAFARPTEAQPSEGGEGKERKPKGRTTKVAAGGAMIFDLRNGQPLLRFDTERIRRVFPVIGGAGFTWTDDSSCWLDFATCDPEGHCRTGTSSLRAPEPVMAVSVRADLERVAACSTRHVLFYRGAVDGEVRFLGRAPIDQPCRKLALTSGEGAVVMLEDRSWVVIRMEPHR